VLAFRVKEYPVFKQPLIVSVMQIECNKCEAKSILCDGEINWMWFEKSDGTLETKMTSYICPACKRRIVLKEPVSIEIVESTWDSEGDLEQRILAQLE
jgi:DNA-directed RNA polymerase subunit RPC12/RpoP